MLSYMLKNETKPLINCRATNRHGLHSILTSCIILMSMMPDLEAQTQKPVSFRHAVDLLSRGGYTHQPRKNSRPSNSVRLWRKEGQDGVGWFKYNLNSGALLHLPLDKKTLSQAKGSSWLSDDEQLHGPKEATLRAVYGGGVQNGDSLYWMKDIADEKLVSINASSQREKGTVEIMFVASNN